MTWVVLTILLSIVGTACVLGAFFARGENRVFWGAGAVAVGIAWVILSVSLSIHNLGTGQVALLYSFSGKLTGSHEQPGTFTTAPWKHVIKENVQVQTENFTLDPTNAAVSRDQQPIYAKLVLNYQVDPKQIVALFQDVGPNWKAKLIESRVLQDFKEVTSTYPTTQITANREQLRIDTRDRLRKELAPYSIDVTDLFVSNIGFNDTYTQAIEQKQVQVQKAAQAQAKVAQVKAEAEQAVAAARGQADANKILTNSISDKLIKLKSIEKLNPNVQVIYVPNGSSLFLPQAASAGGK